MKKNDEVLKGRVLARIHANDLSKVAGCDTKNQSTNQGRDTEIVTDPTWALADHAVSP